ncbi:hypothetical protein RRG08_047066 [Elysia crispata]|uniref:Uncharacterized protein n=1 Tax=Elysia crispata TaxID=231223 RepID=A0AAE1AUU6_9GAST|nr:hypothetical protein RRG08_047066 [Elysia crispata]
MACKTTSAASADVKLQPNTDRSSVFTQTCEPRPDVVRSLRYRILDSEEQTRVAKNRADILQERRSSLLTKTRESCSGN